MQYLYPKMFTLKWNQSECPKQELATKAPKDRESYILLNPIKLRLEMTIFLPILTSGEPISQRFVFSQ